ncbi:MAG: hypothetical protein RSE57_06215, partial [Clostridia bacterium]
IIHRGEGKRTEYGTPSLLIIKKFDNHEECNTENPLFREVSVPVSVYTVKLMTIYSKACPP